MTSKLMEEFKGKMDEKSFRKLVAVENTKLHEFVTDAIALCKPDSVWVRALVGSKGQVLRAEVHRSSGMRELDYAAVESAFESKFEPGISCGRPLAMWVKWKVQFRRNSD